MRNRFTYFNAKYLEAATRRLTASHVEVRNRPFGPVRLRHEMHGDTSSQSVPVRVDAVMHSEHNQFVCCITFAEAPFSVVGAVNRITILQMKPLYTQSGSSSSGDATGDILSLGQWSLVATIGFTLFVYAFEGSLDARQKATYQKTDFPKELQATVSKIDAEREKEKKDGETKPLLEQLQAKFKASQAYGLDKINFGMISSTYDTVESVAFLVLGFLPYIWDKSVDFGGHFFGWTADDEIKVTLIFLLITTIIGTITALPFELYSTFQIERKHGFNKQTIELFFTDKIKSLLLSCAIGGPFVALLLKIIKMGGEHFYIYVWGFMFAFSVLMMTIVPVFVMPLFNKYEPLPDSDLKTKIYELADQLKYPLKKLFVMDGSKRSSHSNAFMFGFGSNKRIGANIDTNLV
jgi:CAAX prenyl protease N-terminal, five membrane helices/Peptidase family M48